MYPVQPGYQRVESSKKDNGMETVGNCVPGTGKTETKNERQSCGKGNEFKRKFVRLERKLCMVFDRQISILFRKVRTEIAAVFSVRIIRVTRKSYFQRNGKRLAVKDEKHASAS
jgi:hypothetical protein